MARRSRSLSPVREVERDPFAIARLRLLPLSVPSLATLGDRRRFDFERLTRPAFVSFGPRLSSRLVVARARREDPRGFLSAAIAFADPRRVDLCRRRETRREVLHAKRIAGGGVSYKRRFNDWSKVRC